MSGTQGMKIKQIIKRERRRRALGLDLMCDWDFAHDNGENPLATRYATNFVEHFAHFKKRGAGLFFFGGAGAGKSYTAAEIVNALTDKGYNCLFTSVLTIQTDLRTLNFEAQRAYLNQIFEKDLVVFDDFGSEGDATRNNELIMQVVNNCRRHSHRRQHALSCGNCGAKSRFAAAGGKRHRHRRHGL